MGAIQLVPAEFGGFIVETLFYGNAHLASGSNLLTHLTGMYVILHIMCMYVLVIREVWASKRHRRPVSKILVASSNILFCTITSVSVI